MDLLEEKTNEEGQEKHVPVIKKLENKMVVSVGSVPHLMEENHYIEWIELKIGDQIYRKFLKAEGSPKAEFVLKANPEKVEARVYCNIHGLWKLNSN